MYKHTNVIHIAQQFTISIFAVVELSIIGVMIYIDDDEGKLAVQCTNLLYTMTHKWNFIEMVRKKERIPSVL